MSDFASLSLSLSLPAPLCGVGRGCAVLDPQEILVRVGAETVLVTTYIEDVIQRRACSQRFLRLPDAMREGDGGASKENQDTFSCSQVWEDVTRVGYYVSNVENYGLEVRHSMKANTFYDESGFDPSYALTDDEMSGVMFAAAGDKKKILKRFLKEEKNVFTIQELMSAAGHRGGLNDSARHDDPGKSLREVGAHVQLNVAYNNIRCNGSWSCAFGVVPTTFRFRVYPVPNAGFEVEDILTDEDYDLLGFDKQKATHDIRIRRIRKGVYVQAVLGGKIARFSPQVLLVNLCSGVGMATLVIAFIDFLARHVLPRKRTYIQQMVREHEKVE